MKRIKILNQYYTDLNYNKSNKEKTIEKLHNLSCMIRFNQDVNSLLYMSELIDCNFLFFASICKHIDVVYTILDYLHQYPLRYMEVSGMEWIHFCKVVATLIFMCSKSEMQSFIKYSLITDESEKDGIFNTIKTYKLGGEMIILEDSDLYAVVKCLMITADLNLKKIWVQKQVEKKFLWLIKRYCHSDLPTPYIDTFQSLKDVKLFVHEDPPITKIVSIWSENIVAAKNISLSLNCHIIFINTYMDFRGSIALLPIEEINHYYHKKSLIKIREKKILEDVHQSINVVRLSRTDVQNADSICNLFYDGTWQKPKKRMYWKYNGSFWANTTNYDIIKCHESAKKGFQTWSVIPIKTRTQILSKFVSILKDNGKFDLATVVEKCLKCRYLYESIQEHNNLQVEVMHSRKPLGVIVFREENEYIFFFRLMQILIAGNSVIVMYDPNFYNLAPYCNVFSTCGIPPGVINILSHEDTHYLQYRLCQDKYTEYAHKYFLKCDSAKKYIEQYKKLTVPKQIILHLT